MYILLQTDQTWLMGIVLCLHKIKGCLGDCEEIYKFISLGHGIESAVGRVLALDSLDLGSILSSSYEPPNPTKYDP